MNKPVPRPRPGVGKPPTKPPSLNRGEPARTGSSVVKPKTPPPTPIPPAEKEDHPSSRLRRGAGVTKKIERAAPAPEPMDRSMRPAGMPLAAKFAIMIGVTVAFTSVIMAGVIYTNVSGEVDREIDDAGVRTTKILCGIDASTVNALGDNTISTKLNDLHSQVKAYDDFVRDQIINTILQANPGMKLPVPKEELDAKNKAMWDTYNETAKAVGKLSGSGGIFLGTLDTKQVPGLINVVFLKTDKQTAISQLNRSESIAIKVDEKYTAGGTNDPVKIGEGRYNGLPVRRYEGTLHDKDLNVQGYVDVYLSVAKIEQVKGKIFTAMLIPLLISVVLGIGIAFFIAAKVTKPVQQLVGDINAVSRGDLDHETIAHSKDEIGVLAKAFNRMTTGLKAAHEAELGRKAAEHEMTIAAEIQSNLLPKKIPKIPGYDISAYYRPSKEVGGDLYDFIQIDQENIAIVVADVSGKGVPGSMIMTMARSLLRMEGERNLSTAETLVKTNRILARDIRRGMFVTCMYMILNARTKTLLVSSAGHNPLVVYRKQTNSNDLVNPNGIALGFDKGPIFERTVKEQRIQLYPGDRFCTYTDGVPEAMSPEDEEFGDDRFYNLCRDLANVDSNQFVNRIVKELDEHKGDREQHDDITLVTARLL